MQKVYKKKDKWDEQKINTKMVHLSSIISVITLSVDKLPILIKRQFLDWDKKNTTICYSQDIHLKCKDTHTHTNRK